MVESGRPTAAGLEATLREGQVGRRGGGAALEAALVLLSGGGSQASDSSPVPLTCSALMCVQRVAWNTHSDSGGRADWR